MHGFVVSEAIREHPPENLALEPYPGNTVSDYFTARNASMLLDDQPDDPDANAAALVPYIFERHPFVFDLSDALTHRYEQARNFMSQYPEGQELLSNNLLTSFQKVHEQLMAGHVTTRTSTIWTPDSFSPQNELDTQRLLLPPVVQEHSLAWNEWAQTKTEQGETDNLFTGEFSRHGVKVANGDLLPMGNLWVEASEGLARIRGNLHTSRDTEAQLGITWEEASGYDGLSLWFLMSHIAEKGILELSETIRPGMINGKHLTPEVYAQSYEPIVDLMDLNPGFDIKGILSDGSWIYSQELADVFPEQHVSKLHDIAGTVVELGPADEIGLPIQAMFATLNKKRNEAYQAGDYRASVAARFIDRRGMIAVLEQFGITKPSA